MCGIGGRAPRDFLFKRAAPHKCVSAATLVCLKRVCTHRKRGVCVFRGLVFLYAPYSRGGRSVPLPEERGGVMICQGLLNSQREVHHVAANQAARALCWHSPRSTWCVVSSR